MRLRRRLHWLVWHAGSPGFHPQHKPGMETPHHDLSTQEWGQEDEEFKVILRYIASQRPARAM